MYDKETVAINVEAGAKSKSNKVNGLSRLSPPPIHAWSLRRLSPTNARPLSRSPIRKDSRG